EPQLIRELEPGNFGLPDDPLLKIRLSREQLVEDFDSIAHTNRKL
ncbi:unnamed protein product, partial [Brassica oleracea var. botrytis]